MQKAQNLLFLLQRHAQYLAGGPVIFGSFGVGILDIKIDRHDLPTGVTLDQPLSIDQPRARIVPARVPTMR